MSNHLKGESSPYLLQHAENPVDWHPWCREAFGRAEKEGKPIFLSIGYSTCHWCHVMARESFENEEIAELLNSSFICIKVDREERPDIDSVYMAVCQAFTGRGGWPMSIFMTADQKPFFAGTYYPPYTSQGMIGFQELLQTVKERWANDRESLYAAADQICSALNHSEDAEDAGQAGGAGQSVLADSDGEGLFWHSSRQDGQGRPIPELAEQAVQAFRESFDADWGGFGDAPKFPSAHNLLFLMAYWRLQEDECKREEILGMVEKTLDGMRRGGIFDQIGFGFSRYSTDRFFLAPHFEKMLYDNALLIMAYSAAYHVTGKEAYLHTAEETAQYLLREMTDGEGGFFSAQDADSDGEEGKYYLWREEEIRSVLGEERGRAFCRHYDVSRQGNFAGKNIPNLLNGKDIADDFREEREKLYLYRRERGHLHLDDKVLTSWNALAICGMAMLYRVSGNDQYLLAAENAMHFLEKNMADGVRLYVGCRNGKAFVNGFLEEYAYVAAALLFLYDVTGREGYLSRAMEICQEAQRQFADTKGGYYLYGSENGSLIARLKETYDGAMPSGNSVMAYCLVRLAKITGKDEDAQRAERQLAWMSGEAKQYPSGHCLFLIASLLWEMSEETVTVVPGEGECAGGILRNLSLLARVRILEQESAEYKRINGKTTYYACKDYVCLPPSNQIYK